MIWLLRLLIWGPKPRDCKVDGHKYRPRYDKIIDPRLTPAQIEDMWQRTIAPYQQRLADSLKAEIYVKDICNGCGDVIERLEGLTPLEVLACQAKRTSG